MAKVKRDNERRVTRGILRAGNSTFDFLFIALMITLLIIAGYMKMDIDSVYEDADPAKFIMYKPELPDDTETFEDLQKLNPDVIGWITIYDTNIDYPLLYSAESNNMYLGHNAKGEPQSSGSIFIDYRNKPDFTDFNTIIHGHHMDQHKMFGDIEKFGDQNNQCIFRARFGLCGMQDPEMGLRQVPWRGPRARLLHEIRGRSDGHRPHI